LRPERRGRTDTQDSENGQGKEKSVIFFHNNGP
jgi:hypothetical protein